MARGKEILFVGPSARGGMAAVLDAYAGMLPEARFVSTYTGGSALRKIADFAKGYARAASLLIAHPSIKIVHIHTASGASFRRKMYFARLAHSLGRKVVMHVHSGRFHEYFAEDPEWIKRSLNSCDEVICLSQQWYDFFKTNGIERVSVVPNPIQYPASISRSEYDERIHFLFLGVLDRAKGIYELVEAVAALPDDIRKSVRVHIGGAGPEETGLREAISSAGVEDNFVLEGWVTGDDKTRLLHDCQCFILPSYFEGLPVSILESMAWAMPVIATTVGGIPSVVETNVNGFLVEPRDARALSAAIGRLTTDADLRHRTGSESRKKAAEYSYEHVQEFLDKIYSRLGVDNH